MRLLLDTNIYVYMVNDIESLTKNVRTLLEDYDNLIIIAQDLSHKMTLVSSDTKFAYYRNQGLDLIENNN